MNKIQRSGNEKLEEEKTLESPALMETMIGKSVSLPDLEVSGGGCCLEITILAINFPRRE